MDDKSDRKKSGSYASPAVEQAAKVLFCLGRSASPSMTLPEICAEVGLAKSKAFSILEGLHRHGLVQRNTEGKGYALGTGLVFLARKVLDDITPARLAAPFLKELAEKAKSTAVFGLRVDRNVLVAAKDEDTSGVSVTMRVGHHLPLTYGAHGKAMAAFMPEKEREALLAGKGLYFYGDPGRFDRARLEQEIARCRKTGFAEDLGEATQGLNVVAAPVRSVSGAPIGYIEVLMLFSPRKAHALGPAVADAARGLSRLLGWKPKAAAGQK
jgi:DNA-binding IclR family transcriptional regulator